MKFKYSQKGFAHLWLIVMLTITICVIGFAIYQIQAKIEKNNEVKSTLSTLCSKENIEICVTTTADKLNYTESTKLAVRVTNNSGKDHASVPNENEGSCSILPVLINGEDKHQVCLGTDMVKFPESIRPGKTENYDVMLDGADLKEGSNKIQVVWAGLSSPTINIIRSPLNDRDKRKLEKCNEGDEQPYCANLNVLIKDGYYGDGITCDDIAKYFTSLKLRPQKSQCSVADIGVVYFIVPKGQEQQWKTKLEAIPQVKSVSISD